MSSAVRKAAALVSNLDRLRLAYAALVTTQVLLLGLYELHRLPRSVALTGGLATSLCGPSLSLRISLHVFHHPRRSRYLDLGSVALSYLVTCLSFAVIYALIFDRDAHAFNLPASTPGLGLGGAIYFSVITITTTGYGDISPASGLARAAVCWEVIVGLMYQVFVFSLVASLIRSPYASEARVPSAVGTRAEVSTS